MLSEYTWRARAGLGGHPIVRAGDRVSPRRKALTRTKGMKPIKAYILLHRYREQTRVARGLIWFVIAAGVCLVGYFAWQLW